jgi:hypothetical protein
MTMTYFQQPSISSFVTVVQATLQDVNFGG